MLLYESRVSGNCYKVRLLLTQLGHRLRAPRTRRRRPLRPARGARPSESGPAHPDAGARRRPAAGRIERDHVLLRRGHAADPRGPLRTRPGAAVDVLRAVQPRAVHRGGAVLADRRDRALRVRARRPSAAAARPRWGQWSTSAGPDVPRRRALHDRRHRPLRLYPRRAGGRVRARAYPAIRAWLGRVAAQPGHIPITA